MMEAGATEASGAQEGRGEGVELSEPAGQEAVPGFSLAAPKAEEARFFLRELEWGEHFIGIDMSPSAGNSEVYLYSLKEAVKFLRNATAGMGLSSGGRGSISWLDVDAFFSWVKDGLGDEELASALERGVGEGWSYHDKVQRIGALVGRRYEQLCILTGGDGAE